MARSHAKSQENYIIHGPRGQIGSESSTGQLTAQVSGMGEFWLPLSGLCHESPKGNALVR